MTVHFSAHQTCLHRRYNVTYEALTKGGKGIQRTIFRRNKMQVFLHTACSVFITVLVSDMLCCSIPVANNETSGFKSDHTYSGIHSLLLRVINCTNHDTLRSLQNTPLTKHQLLSS